MIDAPLFPGDVLSIRTIILACTGLHALTACDSSPAWPPNQAQLTHIFDQQKPTFIGIEKEMASDGLKRMGPVVFSQMEYDPAMPKLPSTQASKYTALFESTQIYLDVTRHEQSTAFELLLQNVGSRLYLPRFIHTSLDDTLPNCAPAMKQASCGTCSIELETDWLLEYSWFPANPEDEAREC